MFSPKDASSRSTLILGPPEITKPFVFEAAIHWAEKGHRVIYITPRPLESLPATYHDRSELSPGAFKLVRFMYLENYDSLIDQLVDLHNFEIVPSILLMDDLNAYTEFGQLRGGRSDVGAPALLALLRDTINACARVINGPVNFLCASFARPTGSEICFREVWRLSVPSKTSDRSVPLSFKLSRDSVEETTKTYDYRYLTDGSLLLKRIFETPPDSKTKP